MADYRVIAVRKGSQTYPYTAIVAIRYEVGNGTCDASQAEVVHALQSATYALHTYVRGARAKVVVATHDGHPYIRTEADSYLSNNLLSLPSF